MGWDRIGGVCEGGDGWVIKRCTEWNVIIWR